MNSEWQKYRTIDKFTYRNRLMVAFVAFLVVFVIAIVSPVVFGNAKWVDWFERGVACNPLIVPGLIGLFFLYLLYAWRITKNQSCPKCQRRCKDQESSGTGQIYLVCHECQLKWDTGLNNSNG